MTVLLVSFGAAGSVSDCAFFTKPQVDVVAVATVMPVDLVIPGCPPTPASLLKGLLALMARCAR